MAGTRYAIEWIYGEFRIARMQNGECVESWATPNPINDLADLNQAMLDASQNIDLTRGGDIAIAYEDDFHTHEFVEVPNISKRDLEKYLHRRVNSKKPFDGEAAWCYHAANQSRNTAGVLLHIMPKDIVDAVIRICEEYYLLPRRLVPLTEVMSEHVQKLDAKPDDILLLIALFNRRTQLVIAHGDGEIYFVRELPYSSEGEKLDRLIIEINRTIGYSKQRIGPRLDKVWLIGEHTSHLINEFQGKLNAEVEVDQTATDQTFWMKEVSELSNKLSSNFVPALARRAVTRKTALRAAIFGAAFFALLSFLITGSVEVILAKQDIDRTEVRNEISSLANKIDKMESDLNEIALEKKRLNYLTADAFNLPAVFLSHLGSLVPAGLVLTQASISRKKDYWEVDIKGLSELPLDQLPPLLDQLQSDFSNEPWNAQITQHWRQVWMQQLRSGGAINDSNMGFHIQGLLK